MNTKKSFGIASVISLAAIWFATGSTERVSMADYICLVNNDKSLIRIFDYKAKGGKGDYVVISENGEKPRHNLTGGTVGYSLKAEEENSQTDCFLKRAYIGGGTVVFAGFKVATEEEAKARIKANEAITAPTHMRGLTPAGG